MTYGTKLRRSPKVVRYARRKNISTTRAVKRLTRRGKL